jgi:hypothetical protein
VLPQRRDPRPGKGYLYVTLHDGNRRRTAAVHVLVLEAWAGPRPGPGYEGCHGNGKRRDNRPVNLSWGTRKRNRAEREQHRRLREQRRAGGVNGTEEQEEIGKEAEASCAVRAVTGVTRASHRVAGWFR